MTRLALSRVHFPVTTLGPGRRVGIWFQGCSIRCRGCISADTWAWGQADTEVGDLIASLAPWLDRADGVTVTGGEPFDQPVALGALLHGLRAACDGDLLVYSGYPLERISGHLAGLAGLIDALITDPYQEDAGDRLPLRGSDNQRLHRLTPRGQALYAGGDCPDAHAKPRALDLMVDEQGRFWMAGIPRRGDFAALRALLAREGHSALTSEHQE